MSSGPICYAFPSETPNYALERTVTDKVQLGLGRASAAHARQALVTPHQPAAQRDRYTTGSARH
jgi:hypothetical protein